MKQGVAGAFGTFVDTKVRGNKNMKLTFVEKRKEAGNVFTFIFKPKTRSDLVWFVWKPGLPASAQPWQAGQYLFYTIPNSNPDIRGVTRYFTISSAPFEKHIAITTKIFEKPSTFKKSLLKLKIGDEIEANGPDGDFVIEDPKRNLVFIAGGIGITPFRSILLDLSNRNLKPSIRLLYANHDENIVFKEELESLKNKNSNLKINYFISPTYIDEATVKSQLLIVNRPLVFISGPSPFVRTIRVLILDQGVEKENIKTDSFSGYS